jgi:hypothetical protein
MFLNPVPVTFILLFIGCYVGLELSSRHAYKFLEVKGFYEAIEEHGIFFYWKVLLLDAKDYSDGTKKRHLIMNKRYLLVFFIFWVLSVMFTTYVALYLE